MTLKIKLSQSFINTWKTSSQNSLHTMQILSFFHLFIRHSGIRTCIRQELLRKNKKINNTRNSNKNTDFPQLEHRKTFISGFKNHTMHNQIGRSTDQCTDIINYRPDKKRKKHTWNTFLIEYGCIPTHRKQQSSRYHHKKRYARTQHRPIDSPPKLDIFNIRSRSRIKVERVCAMTTNHGKHSYQSHDIQPNNTGVRLRRNVGSSFHNCQ